MSTFKLYRYIYKYTHPICLEHKMALVKDHFLIDGDQNIWGNVQFFSF